MRGFFSCPNLERPAARALLNLLPLAIAALLAACGTVPLSTAARLGAFDEKDFASLDPREIRVRVAVPEGYTWEAEAAQLHVGVDAGDRSRSDDFRLARVSEDHGLRGGGFLAPGARVLVTTLRLADSSQPGFRALQRFVAVRGVDRVRLDVGFSLLTAPAHARSVPVWIEAMLSPRQGYFLLVDGGTVPLNATQTYGTPDR